MTAHRFNPIVLREYDIRGTVGKTLYVADAAALGRTFGSVLMREGGPDKRCCVGYDGRTTSPEFEAALVEGLASTGVDVIRVGLGPTPFLYFCVFHLGVGGGIMVTGSHNPKDQNGFKLMLGKKSFHGQDIARLGPLAARGNFAAGKGKIAGVRPMDAYLEALVAAYRPAESARALDVSWDPGNGAAGDVVRQLAKQLPGKHVLINDVIDGTFPAHHPDPTVEANLAQLQETVRKNKSDIGLAFDGDGDRLGVVDHQGNVVWADKLLALLAREVLAERPGATIIADVKSSQGLYDEIARLGGRPLMWRTGHALIKAKLFEIEAPLAGELSGHLFFADHYYGFDDAIYAAVRVLAMVARSGKRFADLVSTLPTFVSTPELRIHCAEERKFAVVAELLERMRAAGAKVSDIDGVRVTTAGGWWLVRASNTEAALVARAEGRDERALDSIKQLLADELRKSGVSLPL